MGAARLKALAQDVARHPWSSLQDGLLVAMAMLVAALLALQYNLFWFIAELSEPQRKISLAEAIFLTILLALCIVAFVIRRLHEERRDAARQVTAKTQLRQFRWRASRDFPDESGEPPLDAQSFGGSSGLVPLRRKKACVSSDGPQQFQACQRSPRPRSRRPRPASHRSAPSE